MTTINLKETSFEFDLSSGFCMVTLPDGRKVAAVPRPTAEYKTDCFGRGYSGDLNLFCIENKAAYILLSYFAGLPESPALRAESRNEDPKQYKCEHDAVLLFQAFCRNNNKSIIDLLAKASAEERSRNSGNYGKYIKG